MNQSRKLTDGALMLAIFMVLLFITMYAPLLGVISLFILPLPFTLYASRYDWKPSMLILLVAIVISILFATIFAMGIPIMMGIGGIMIGSAIYKGLSAYDTLLRGTLGFVIGLLFLFVFSQTLLGLNFVEEFKQMSAESIEMSTAMLEQVGSEEQIGEIEEMMQLQMELFLDIIPVIIVISSVLFALVSQWISYKIINRLERQELAFPPFRSLRFPMSIIWIYFITLVVSFIEMEPSSLIYLGIQNIFVLTGILMTIQGFSFIFFYAHHKKMSKVIPIMSVIVALLLSGIFLYLIRILGIIDIGFRLRDHLTKNNN